MDGLIVIGILCVPLVLLLAIRERGYGGGLGREFADGWPLRYRSTWGWRLLEPGLEDDNEPGIHTVEVAVLGTTLPAVGDIVSLADLGRCRIAAVRPRDRADPRRHPGESVYVIDLVDAPTHAH